MSKPKKAIELAVEVPPIKIPWTVARFFKGGHTEITFSGKDVSIGEDYGSVQELRKVIDWLADQFGGKVKWSKHD